MKTMNGARQPEGRDERSRKTKNPAMNGAAGRVCRTLIYESAVKIGLNYFCISPVSEPPFRVCHDLFFTADRFSFFHAMNSCHKGRGNR